MNSPPGGKNPTTIPTMPPPTPPYGSPFSCFLDDFIKMCEEKNRNNNSKKALPYSDANVIWNTMSDDEKAPYVQKRKRLWEDYENAMALYSNKLLEDKEEILANMKNVFNDPVTTPSTTHLDNKNELGSKSDSEKQHHVEANENELGLKSDSEKQHRVEANDNELGSKSDSKKQHHVEANENELGLKSDSEKQHHDEAPFDIPAHHKTSCALARNILQAYSFQSAEEIGNYFLDNRGKIITMVNQLI